MCSSRSRASLRACSQGQKQIPPPRCTQTQAWLRMCSAAVRVPFPADLPCRLICDGGRGQIPPLGHCQEARTWVKRTYLESRCEGSGAHFCQRGASALLLHLTGAQFPHLQTEVPGTVPGTNECWALGSRHFRCNHRLLSLLLVIKITPTAEGEPSSPEADGIKSRENPLVQVESKVDAAQLEKQEESLEGLGRKEVGRPPGADPSGWAGA